MDEFEVQASESAQRISANRMFVACDDMFVVSSSAASAPIARAEFKLNGWRISPAPQLAPDGRCVADAHPARP